MKILIITSLTMLALYILIPEIALAQLPPNMPMAPNQTPIDGGLGAVALGAGALALRKLRNMRNGVVKGD